MRGDKNAWLHRSVHQPENNAEEMRAALQRGSAEMGGVVARLADEIVGWMKLAPAGTLDKLYAQRLYRGLECLSGDRTGVYTIACFLVDPAVRRQGVARALVDAGLSLAERLGARTVEAFPRRADMLRPEEMWTGPMAALEGAGFRVVHDFAPYPVLRCELAR